jgi:hypothetical protein
MNRLNIGGSEHPIVWECEQTDDFEEIIREDLFNNDVADPENLMIHVVFLGNRINDPVFIVTGGYGDDSYHVTYEKKQPDELIVDIRDFPEDSPLRKMLERKDEEDG